MKDLTKGNITKLILMFSLPLLLGNIFQLFYNLADTDERCICIKEWYAGAGERLNQAVQRIAEFAYRNESGEEGNCQAE